MQDYMSAEDALRLVVFGYLAADEIELVSRRLAEELPSNPWTESAKKAARAARKLEKEDE